VAKEAGAELVCGTSLKAALDRDWDQSGQREEALGLILEVLQARETWMQTLQQEDAELAQPSLEVARQIQAQDVQVDEEGKASLIKGVAKDRRISIEDGQMRNVRKSRSVRVDGDIRHVLHDLDSGLIRAVGVTPANVPQASVTEAISQDLERQGASLKELHIDRAYLSSQLVRERSDEPCGVLQRLAGPGKPIFSQASVSPGLATANHLLPRQAGDAFCPWWGGSLSQRQLCPVPECSLNALAVPKDAASASIPMKRGYPNYDNVSLRHRDGPNYANGWRLSIPSHMLVGGKGDVLVIVGGARISSICAAVLWSIICTSWLVPSRFRLSFRPSLDYLTDALGDLFSSEKNAGSIRAFDIRTVMSALL
jgi:hypothetical protein